MKLIALTYLLLIPLLVNSQYSSIGWYSESENNGLIIRNSFPKGGPYTGKTSHHHNYSYLVFFSQIKNERENILEFNLHFSADSIPIPNSPGTFMKLFLPKDSMTLDKVNAFSYGITKLDSFYKPTYIHKSLQPEESFMFYVVAVFYQLKDEPWVEERGGNRAELILNNNDLIYNLKPQVNLFKCGSIRAIND